MYNKPLVFSRFEHLDALRGAAVLWMTVFHFCFDLSQFHFLEANFFCDPLWLWQRTGWQIHNFEKRQSLSAAADLVRQSKVKASIKGNCVRHHGAECGCWKEAS